MEEKRPACPECGSKMSKAGGGPSGRAWVQRWRCSNRDCYKVIQWKDIAALVK